jgi:mannose-6-phosphate isomerase-like protein (cupin superfamily)
MLIQKLNTCEEFIAGDAVYIPPLARQFIRNCEEEPLVFMSIVDPAWCKENEMIYPAVPLGFSKSH